MTTAVLLDVAAERTRQEQLKTAGRFKYTCADVDCPDGVKLAVLGEEFGEVCRALCAGAHDPEQDLRSELLQVAAVAVAWIEALDADVSAADAATETMRCSCTPGIHPNSANYCWGVAERHGPVCEQGWPL